jgi:pyruvate formate lyase activating enzyme
MGEATSVVPTRYWHALEDGRVQCDLCPRFCKLHEGQRGFCFVRGCQGGEVVLTTYGRSSGFCVDPVEKKPLYHFLPGTPVLSFGTAGCNLGCRFCQNWDISKSRETDTLADDASPEAIAEAAVRLGCRGVAFTYNDPVIFHEYAIDVAAACRARGVKAIAVTAGEVCPEPRAEFYRHVDAANVDLKGFTEDFYHDVCAGHLQPVLDTLVYLERETSVWLEVTTLLIPGLNDSDAELEALTAWFADNLGPDVPLHFTAFHPDFRMTDRPPTPPATLRRARRIARENGLAHVYVGTVDPKNPTIKQGVAGLDSMFFVPGKEAEFEDNRKVPHGEVRKVWYPSSTLGEQRRMHVYTPPGYDAGKERYPVLYLLHGGGDEDSGWSTVGRAGFILDNLLADKKARPMLVVMPNGSLPRPANLPPLKPGERPSPEVLAALAAAQERFTNELLKDVIPWVEKNYRVVADGEHRAIAGLSMGGGQTLRVVTGHPGQFAYVGVWSAGIGRNAEEFEKRNEAFFQAADKVNKAIRLFSIRVGDKDFALASSKALAELLTKHGIKHELHVSGGGHTWINWRHYLNDLAPRLFQDVPAEKSGAR